VLGDCFLQDAGDLVMLRARIASELMYGKIDIFPNNI
jgi:hypothetical protein